MNKKSSTPDEGASESFVSHLIELRDRLLRSVIAVLIIFIPAAIFSGDLFTLLAKPMLSALSTSGTMISTEVAGPFLVPLKFAFALSVAIAIPYLLYQVWSFVAPGLYENEKRLAFPLLLSSTLLFYCGIAFAYFVVFPIMFNFFPSVAPTGIEVSPDINHYLGFVLKLFFAFGIAFEVPIATIILIKAGITTPEQLASKRRYVVLGAFVVGMLLTPPDIFSQSMLAIPMWMLFELGLIMSKMMGSRASGESEDDEDDDQRRLDAKPGDETDGSEPGSGDGDDDVIEPAIMPQQARYAETDGDDDLEEDMEEVEEDLDKLAEELDALEDITSWVEQSKSGEDSGDVDVGAGKDDVDADKDKKKDKEKDKEKDDGSREKKDEQE